VGGRDVVAEVWVVLGVLLDGDREEAEDGKGEGERKEANVLVAPDAVGETVGVSEGVNANGRLELELEPELVLDSPNPANPPNFGIGRTSLSAFGGGGRSPRLAADALLGSLRIGLPARTLSFAFRNPRSSSLSSTSKSPSSSFESCLSAPRFIVIIDGPSQE